MGDGAFKDLVLLQIKAKLKRFHEKSMQNLIDWESNML
jgi:hypothetical protein